MIKKQKSLRNIAKVREIRTASPQPDLIREAAGIIKNGGVISFPTTCLYGLGADAFNARAVARLFKIKQRPDNKPILVLIKNIQELNRIVREVPPAAFPIMTGFWPGGVTLVFKAGNTLPDNLTAGTGKIGVRLPEHPVAFALLKALDCPLTGTSANISGRPACSRIPDLDFRIGTQLDLILDAGPLKGGIGSTVVDVTSDSPKILREGKVPARDILAVLGRH